MKDPLESNVESWSELAPNPTDKPRPSGPRPRTDLGNAERFVEKFGHGLRYGMGKWFVWDRRRWREDDTGEAMRCATKTARGILKEAANCEDSADRKNLTDWARESEFRSRLEAMIKVASADERIVVRADDLDAHPWLLNVQNGTIDLRTGTLKAHDRNDLITKVAPVNYDPAAGCQRFMTFLDQVFRGRPGMIRFVQRWHGHCLTGDISEQYLPIYHGEGANGKSVLLDTFMGMMGDYATMAPPYLLVATNGQREHPTEIAGLRGQRFVLASETEEGAALKLQLLKKLTGDKRLKGRFMHKDYVEFTQTHKTVLVTNNKPVVREHTEAVRRRLRLVPFDVVIPAHERDTRLIDKLRSEWAGILAFFVRGSLDWQRDGLGEPPEVTKATDAYLGCQDIFGRLGSERLVLDREHPPSQSSLFTPWEIIWRDHCEWAKSAGGGLDAGDLRKAFDKAGFPTGDRQWRGKKTRGRPGVALKSAASHTEARP